MDPGRIPPTTPELVLRYPRFGTGISRYLFERRDSVVATMPSGENQVQVLGRLAYLTLAWVAADSGTSITATLDSVVADTGAEIPAALLDSARGTRWTTLRPPAGGLTVQSGTRTSLLGDQVRDQLVLLFPRLPAEGARPGAAWSDSTEAPARVSAFEALERVVAHSTAGPPGTVGFPIDVVTTRSATSQATQYGQTIGIRATGSDTLSYEMLPDGRVTLVSGRRSTALVLELSAIGQSVPVQETSSLRMTLLR
jgi:hypothetical protein